MRFSLNELSVSRVSAAMSRRVVDLGESLTWNFTSLGSRARAGNAKYKNIHKGEVCVVVCNGPSVNKTNMKLLKDYKTICMNRSYLMYDEWGFQPTYFAAIAEQVLTQFADDIRKLPMPKFIDCKHRALYPENDSTHYLRLPPRLVEKFNADLTGPMTSGGTVTYIALQIAYYMGFKKVIIVGMDHRFSEKGTPNTTQVRKTEDRDHMHPNYFPAGMKWQLPDLVRSELSYSLARQAFEADGRQIIDATVDGACTIFERSSLEDALGITPQSLAI